MSSQAKSNRTAFIDAAENIAAAETEAARARIDHLVATAKPLTDKLTELKNYYGTFDFRSEKCKDSDYLTIKFTKGLRTGNMFIPGIDFTYYALFVSPGGDVSFGVWHISEIVKDRVTKSFATTDEAVEHIVKELGRRNLLKTPVRGKSAWFNPLRLVQKILS